MKILSKKKLIIIAGAIVALIIIFAIAAGGSEDEKFADIEVEGIPDDGYVNFGEMEIPDLSLFKYSLDKTGEGVAISGYNGHDIAMLKIPSEIEGLPVVEVTSLEGDDWRNDEVRAVEIPDTVKVLGPSLFSNWKNLESVTLSASIEAIDYMTFYQCINLKEVVIPNGVKSIGSDTFSGSGIKSLVIPDSVTEIKKNLFSNCYYLEDITLSKNITTISENMFSGCISLRSVVIPEGVTIINREAFAHCVSLESVIIPGTVKVISDNVFSGCSSLKELVIPEGVEWCGSNMVSASDYVSEAFKEIVREITGKEYTGKVGLVSLTFPDSLTLDPDYNCYQVPLPYNSLYTLEDLEYLRLPDTITEMKSLYLQGQGSSIYTELKKLKSVNIPASVKSIADNAFAGLSNLTDLRIPDSLEHIDFLYHSTAFKETSSLPLATQKRLRELGYDGEF